MFKNLKHNLKNILISIACDIICLASGIFAIKSVMHGDYWITAICLVILGYFAYLERHGKISPW